ncbi:hypothetical protein [Marinobacter sp.]|uniref:hypothetical protein n=1 Tax=Marinobacter sp. TaxID=50741 RepID=UPI0035650264
MIKQAIEKILSLAGVQTLVFDERSYTDKHISPVLLPEPQAVGLNTLTGIKDYLGENPDGHDLDTVLIHIEGPTMVQVFSRLSGPFVQRMPYLEVSHVMPVFPFGKYMDIETFIIELQAKFVQDELTAQILQLVGTITDDLIQVYADDGVSQQVTAKSGIGRVQQCLVPNPVVLSPYRSFNEIEQPPGRFVFRLKSGNGTTTGRPAVALFEADGGAWQLEAIQRIRQWLRDNVPEEVVVIA